MLGALGKTANEINIFVDTGGKKDEGDFEAIEFTLALTKAADADEKSKNKSAVERLVESTKYSTHHRLRNEIQRR